MLWEENDHAFAFIVVCRVLVVCYKSAALQQSALHKDDPVATLPSELVQKPYTALTFGS